MIEGIYYSALLVVVAFWLGACPFSVWIGRWFLGKDIRNYGDGNPGAANVFRAGGRKTGLFAVEVVVEDQEEKKNTIALFRIKKSPESDEGKKEIQNSLK